MSETVYLLELSPFSASEGQEVPQFLASLDLSFAEDPSAPAVEYLGLLQASSIRLQRRLNEDAEIGVIGGLALPGELTLKLLVDETWLTDWKAWQSYAWDGRGARLLKGQRDAAYSSYQTIFDGVILEAPRFRLAEVTLRLGDLRSKLDREFPLEVYSGAGGFEGSDDLKDQSKPELLGRARAIQPVFVNRNTLWLDVSASGLSIVDKVLDGGVRLTATNSSAPAAGFYYVDLAAGRIRLGASPEYDLLVDAVGAEAAGSTSAPKLIETILIDYLGLAASELDLESFAVPPDPQAPTDSLRSAVTGVYLKDPGNALEAISRLAQSIGHVLTADQQGRLRLVSFEPPSASSQDDPAVVAVFDDQDIQLGSVEIAPVSSPPSRVEVGYRQAWNTRSESDLDAVNATAAEKAFLAESWRIAAEEDGASPHLLSDSQRVNSALDDQQDAIELLTRLRAAFSNERFFLRVTVALEPFELELMEEVWVSSRLYQIEGSFRVIASDETPSSVSLTLWR